MFRDELRSLWSEPRPPGPPPRVWRDWVLVAATLIATVLEVLFRPGVVWWPVSVLVTLGLAAAVLWRRTHPMVTVVLAFGTGILLDLIDLAAHHTRPIGLYSGSIIVVLIYALTRWGSGREIIAGTAVILTSFGLTTLIDGGPAGDVIGSLSFLTLVWALGAMVRLREAARRREHEQVRARERASIARELHDTVAHHVSAIVVRAQAGRVLAGADPLTAVDTLAGVEEEGARTLEAMRAMVMALRDDGHGAALTPLPGIADLERLPCVRGGALPVELRVDGTAGRLPPAVDAAVYRIVQESVTNATRHAAGATSVQVRIRAERGHVLVTITDDGGGGRKPAGGGYGIAGLRERAALLGGRLNAGPRAGGGWMVEAELPCGEEAERVHSRGHR